MALDMEGREVAVGDHVYTAVTSYRSGKLTKAVVESIDENLAASESYRWRFHLKTVPGNRRTSCYGGVVKV